MTAVSTLSVAMSDAAATSKRTLDAREIDGEPFTAIVEALDALPAGEELLLVNSFEPEPLYDVLRRRGYRYETTQEAADEWHVAISRA